MYLLHYKAQSEVGARAGEGRLNISLWRLRTELIFLSEFVQIFSQTKQKNDLIIIINNGNHH
jgi:hypothetical protein